MACTRIVPDFGIPGDFFPAARYLGEGVVNKYYVHFDSKDGYTKSTNISYMEYRATAPKALNLSMYDPAFEIRQEGKYKVEEDQILMESMSFYYQGEATAVKITDPVHSDWKRDTANLVTETLYSNGTNQVNWQHQQAVRDTMVMGRPGKVFERTRKTFNTLKDGTEKEYLSTSRLIYLEDIGLFSMTTYSEDGVYRQEFIEQMPKKVFQEKANHDVKRVAYIDPDKTMDQSQDFTLCDTPKKIVDYYNGRPNAGMIGGKKMLKNWVRRKLKPTKLGQVSGYLTFRFVVNCKGKAGWFITEQADLDFQPTTFPDETINHLHRILAEVSSWQACEVREEARDAYTYITFKLKHGKIIEFLP